MARLVKQRQRCEENANAVEQTQHVREVTSVVGASSSVRRG